MAIFIFFTLEIIDTKISLRQVNSVTRQSKQGACFTLECVAVLQQMREKTHTHTNHPTIHDVHDVGGGVELSEGWSVKQGAGDQGSDPWIRKQLSSLSLCFCFTATGSKEVTTSACQND